MRILILILVMFLSSCAWDTELDLSIGHVTNSTPSYETNDQVCHFVLRQVHEDGWYAGYSHTSFCFRGAPFNNKGENWRDEIQFGKQWIIRKGK